MEEVFGLLAESKVRRVGFNLVCLVGGESVPAKLQSIRIVMVLDSSLGYTDGTGDLPDLFGGCASFCWLVPPFCQQCNDVQKEASPSGCPSTHLYSHLLHRIRNEGS